MPKFLRNIVRTRWYTAPNVEWLKAGQLSGDVLKDLGTTDGKLSIYEVPYDYDPTRIAIAIAANRPRLGPVDYLIFDGDILQPSVFPLEKTPGETPDFEVNTLHHDLLQLTTDRLVSLVGLLSEGDKERVEPKPVKEALLEGLNSGALNVQHFSQTLLKDLGWS